MSILSHLEEQGPWPKSIHFLYSCRLPASEDLDSILFLDRLREILVQSHRERSELSKIDKKLCIYLTGIAPEKQATTHEKAIHDYAAHNRLEVYERRFTHEDIVDVLGPEERREKTVAYICGPPSMTDEVVETLRNVRGMAPDKVLCEKWW